MPFEQLTPRPLTPGGIRMYAPEASGVYGISNAREWIYIGQADNIRNALLIYLSDTSTSLMQNEPTGFVFEACRGPARATRQDRLILEYRPTRAAHSSQLITSTQSRRPQ